MLQAQKQVRFFEVAKAMQAIARYPEKTLDLALEVSDEIIVVIEDNLHHLAKVLDGDPLASEIEAWLNPRMTPRGAPPIVPEANVSRFAWAKIKAGPGARLGDMFAGFECRWHGMTLKIEKRGPANYEGLIDGQHFAQSRFKKSLRERLEKEAAKRANV